MTAQIHLVSEKEREDKNGRESWKRKKRRGEEISSSAPQCTHTHALERGRGEDASAILSWLNLHLTEVNSIAQEIERG